MSKFWHLQSYKTNIANCTQSPSNLFIIYSLDLIYHFYNNLITFSVILAFDIETAWGWFTVFSALHFYVNTLAFSQHVWNKLNKFCSFYSYTKFIDFVEQHKRSQYERWKTSTFSGRWKSPISHSTEENGINQQPRPVMCLTAFICCNFYYSCIYQLS